MSFCFFIMTHQRSRLHLTAIAIHRDSAYSSAMITALDAARYFLSKQDTDEPDISNMKLLKLLYYAQGTCLAILDRPLFDEAIEAWRHGPVVASIYQTFKNYQANPIPATSAPAIPDEERHILDLTFAKWGEFSASALRNRTHREPPWQEAYHGRGEGSEIDLNEIYQAFLSELSVPAMGNEEFDRRFAAGVAVA